MVEKETVMDNKWEQIEFDDEKKNENVTSTFINQKILRMMSNMGYQSGLGLGKNEQGIVQPVTIEPNFQRSGLGLLNEGVKYSNEKWDYTLDPAAVNEEVKWLHNNTHLQFKADSLKNWPKEEKSNINIENEYNFCDKEILHNVLKAKDVFNELDLRELNLARGRANPFETIRSVFFMNRASLKMANIDAATGFLFSNIDDDPLHGSDGGPYFFADVCAGPGGFTEYILWRKKWHFKGFGLTLKGDHDFKLTESVCASPVTFLPLYGAHGDGNVCCPENIEDFKQKVIFETENKGVHFMMSDGGFSVEGNENMQEVLSKNIYLCQCLVALEILREHGHFVTKLFDVFTCFSVGLLYLIYNCFEKVCILKPNSSRPANSERYLVCQDYKGHDKVQNIINYIRKLAERLWELKDNEELDITEIVPLSVLTNDCNFYSYIRDSNIRIAKCQTVSLQKLGAFCRNPTLLDHRQEHLRKSCLDYWRIPDQLKVPLPNYTPEELFSEVLGDKDLFFMQPQEIGSFEELKKISENLQDWYYTFVHNKANANSCNFYAGVGVSKVYRFQCNQWKRVKNFHLVRGTLLYGEFVKEKCVSKHPENQLQNKYSLHVIDAFQLGDQNLTDMNFEERIRLISSYCKAVNHEFRTNAIRIRPKVINKLESVLNDNNYYFPIKSEITTSLVLPLPVLGYNVVKEFCEVNSTLFFKTIKDEYLPSMYLLNMELFKTDKQIQEANISFEGIISFFKNKKS